MHGIDAGLRPIAGLAVVVGMLAACAIAISFVQDGARGVPVASLTPEVGASGPVAANGLLISDLPVTETAAADPAVAGPGVYIIGGAEPQVEGPSPQEGAPAAPVDDDAARGDDALPTIPVPGLKRDLIARPFSTEKPIMPTARYLVDDVVLAFASADDFTGGRESLFADYAQARLRERTEKSYSTVVLAKGQTVEETLVAVGGGPDEIVGLLEAVASVIPLSQVAPGLAIEFAFETNYTGAAPVTEDLTESGAIVMAEAPDPGPQMILSRLRIRPDKRHVVTAWRTPDGQFTARKDEIEVTTRYAAVTGVIRQSLSAAAQRSGVPAEIFNAFSNLFIYDIDFVRDIHRGDRFEVVYEVYYDDQGQRAGTGEILFAAMNWSSRRKSRGYYRFDEVQRADIPYFDTNGESANRLLMKTPIEGAQVTSSFGLRRHPVLGYTKQHKGVDFGAPRGTPVMAAGDGEVTYAKAAGTFGNLVRIDHAQGFSTAYAHLDRFALKVKKGSRVRQGDIIGYVGSTGRSTGPHLHYEVTWNKEIQNPETLDVATGRKLPADLATDFSSQRAFVDTLRISPLTMAAATQR